MSDERLRCAELALRQVPEGYRRVDATDVTGQAGGHSFHRGMHIGWAWGEDGRGRVYLDFLSEHPEPGMQAERYFADGTAERIATPAPTRMVSSDPAQDAALERDFFENNAAAYADLRDRGLLPARGENVELQDINEYLLQGDAHHGRSNIGPATPAGPSTTQSSAAAGTTYFATNLRSRTGPSCRRASPTSARPARSTHRRHRPSRHSS